MRCYRVGLRRRGLGSFLKLSFIVRTVFRAVFQYFQPFLGGGVSSSDESGVVTWCASISRASASLISGTVSSSVGGISSSICFQRYKVRSDAITPLSARAVWVASIERSRSTWMIEPFIFISAVGRGQVLNQMFFIVF